MRYTIPVVIPRPHCPIIGLSITTTLEATRLQGTVKRLYQTMLARGDEIESRTGSALMLVQVYPRNRVFGDTVRYKVILGAPVARLDRIPHGMIGHLVPGGDYAMFTHVGPESTLGATYRYVYGRGLMALGRYSAGHDFEVLDARYQPDRADNVIDIYVALGHRPQRRRSFLSDDDARW